MTIDFTSDDQLGDLLRAEVPAPSDRYWPVIDTMLGGDRDDGPVAQPIDLMEDPSTIPFRSRLLRGVGGTAGLLAAAALLIVVASVVGTRWNRTSETVDTGFATDPASLAALAGPQQNLDHWHAVYGVWDCTLADGAGGWVPAFQSTDDATGIHSHGDGMIYIHPFFEHSAGRNATFAHFVSEMNLELTDTSLTLDDGRTLLEGTMCDGQKSVLHLRRWQSDFAARGEAVSSARIITNDLNGERFYNDREVWVLALAPIDADIPLPPRERFAELDNWLPGDRARPPAVSGTTATALEATVVLPLERPVYATGSDAEQIFEQLIREPRPGWTETIVADTFRPIATASHSDFPAVVMAAYRIDVGDGETRGCVATIDIAAQVIRGSTYCRPNPITELMVDESGSHLFLPNVMIGTDYVVVSTQDGERIVTNVVERHVFVHRDFTADPIEAFTFYDSALAAVATCPRSGGPIEPACMTLTAE